MPDDKHDERRFRKVGGFMDSTAHIAVRDSGVYIVARYGSEIHSTAYTLEWMEDAVRRKEWEEISAPVPPIAAPAASYMNKLWSQCKAPETRGSFKGAEWECHTCGASSASPECRWRNDGDSQP